MIMNILFIGDVVGKPGMDMVSTWLPSLEKKYKADLVIVNAENSSDGKGCTEKEGKVLFIFRRGHWDLPKGKWEVGESFDQTAVREVEEECGIPNLKIEEPLEKTYHIFYENNRNKLKITHWFLMGTTSNDVPVPQKEEGITKAVYEPIDGIFLLLDKMYANISDLLKNIFQN